MNQKNEELLAQVRDYILSNLQNKNKELSIAAVCIKFGIGRTVLQSLFNSYYAMPLHAFILQSRMEKARDLLKTTEDPIKSVASQCGYKNIHSFNKTFKATWFVSPGQYRMRETAG